MHEKVQQFLNEQKKEVKSKMLIDLGLYEKIYSPNNQYSEQYSECEFSYETGNQYFYKKPYEISDEEFEELKKYTVKKIPENPDSIATTLNVIGVLTYIGCFIAGCFFIENALPIAFTYWVAGFIAGTNNLGFARIIHLLTDIKNK